MRERERYLVEDPERMIVGAAEELVDGGGVFGVDFSVIDEVFAGEFGVVTPAVLRQAADQPQHLAVSSQHLLHLSVNH